MAAQRTLISNTSPDFSQLVSAQRRFTIKLISHKHDEKATSKIVVAFLYQNGLIELYDLAENKIAQVALPKRVVGESFTKLFHLEKSGFLAEGSNKGIVFWDLIENNSQLRLRYKLVYEEGVKHWVTTQVGERVIIVKGSSGTGIHFDARSLTFQEDNNLIIDLFLSSAEEGDIFFEQYILSLHPLDATSLVVLGGTYDEEDEELPFQLDVQGGHNLIKYIVPMIGSIGSIEKISYPSYTTEIQEIVGKSNICFNGQGDCAVWDHRSGYVRIVLANNEWGLGWQDHVYREIGFQDLDLSGPNLSKSVHFISSRSLLFVVKNYPHDGLLYLLYEIISNKTVRKIADSRYRWPKVNLMFPINEDELIIQGGNKILLVDVCSGDVIDKIIDNAIILYEYHGLVLNKAKKVVALTSLNKIFVLYVQKKKFVHLTTFGKRVNEIVPLNNRPLLALTLESSVQNIIFVSWKTGEVITSYNAKFRSDIGLHLHGCLGKELFFSSGERYLQGLQISDHNEKYVNFPLRKDKGTPHKDIHVEYLLLSIG